MIKDYISVDLTVLICMLLILLGLAIYAYRRYRRRNQKRTLIQLELGNSEHNYTLTWAELPLTATFCTFGIDKTQFRIRFQTRFYGSALIVGECLKVENKPLCIPQTLPLEIPVYWLRTRTMMEIMRSQYYVSINIVRKDGELMEVILIKPLVFDSDHQSLSVDFSLRNDVRLSVREPKHIYPKL